MKDGSSLQPTRVGGQWLGLKERTDHAFRNHNNTALERTVIYLALCSIRSYRQLRNHDICHRQLRIASYRVQDDAFLPDIGAALSQNTASCKDFTTRAGLNAGPSDITPAALFGQVRRVQKAHCGIQGSGLRIYKHASETVLSFS